MALPSFVQQLAVLEEAGLVHSMKEGRVRTCRLAPEGLEVAGAWLEEQRRL
jgi:DNA-binding transcriptional ArsR family regulator